MAENLYDIRNAVRTGELRSENYKGKQRFMVCLENEKVIHVTAPTVAAAIWTAAKHWGLDPRKADFHQGCRVVRC